MRPAATRVVLRACFRLFALSRWYRSLWGLLRRLSTYLEHESDIPVMKREKRLQRKSPIFE